jgi:hypothetical protein
MRAIFTQPLLFGLVGSAFDLIPLLISPRVACGQLPLELLNQELKPLGAEAKPFALLVTGIKALVTPSFVSLARSVW